MKNKKLMIGSIIFMIIFIAVTYYLFLPAINIQNPGFWAYMFIIVMVGTFIKLITSINFKTGRFNISGITNFTEIVYIITGAVFLIIMIINVISSPLFNSSSYSKRITIDEEGDFSKDINEVDFNSIPLLDKASSTKLGDRVMGEMTDLVSQFYVSDLYTQINYNNEVVRVTPLEYSGVIKYFTNRDEGVKGYIIVSSTTGESKLIKLDK